MSLPIAKNAMRRAVADLLSRPLTPQQKDQIWEFFDSHCAYCDKFVDRMLRHGHMDHLDCTAAGGGKYISNRVLACKECNGNEKRDLEWQSFLRSKSPNGSSFKKRREKIRKWQKQFPKVKPIVLYPEAQEAKVAVDAAIAQFEQAFKRFRSLVR